MELGRVGVWTSYRTIGEENAGEAARLVALGPKMPLPATELACVLDTDDQRG